MVVGTVPPPHRQQLLSSSSPWSDLHEELLMVIFKRLNWSDLYQCLGVCSFWRSITRPVINQILKPPFLLLLHENQELCRMLDLEANTLSLSERLELSSYTIYDSNNGWLLMYSINRYYGIDYKLYNPVTREVLQLPPPPSVPPGVTREVLQLPAQPEAIIKVFSIDKMVITKKDPRDPDCVVYIYSDHFSLLAFWKPSSRGTVNDRFKLVGGKRSFFVDMLSHKGELYALDISSLLFVMKVVEIKDEIFVQKCPVVREKIISCEIASEFYLVEEPGTEELLLIDKNSRVINGIWKTEFFRRFKLKYSPPSSASPTSEYGYWWPASKVARRSEDFTKFETDNHALLLVSGDSRFVSTLGDSQSCYKSNCIYYFDFFQNARPLDYLKVYDLKSQKEEAFNFNSSYYENNNSLLLSSAAACRWFRTTHAT